MAKKAFGWILMALTIVALSVLVGVNGKYIFTKDKYYSQKELDAKVEEAYENGVNSNTDLLESILFYKNEAEKNKATADSIQAELDKEKENSLAISNELKTALADKKTAENKIVALNKQISDNNLTIQQNEDEIARLETRIAGLEEAGATNNAEIVSLNATINSLRQTNTSLQETNSSNLETISSLNAQITTLNTKIADLNTTQTENLATISQLNTKISQLNSSISYYETYLKTLETGENVILTFEYNGSVYNIQVVSKGSSISITAPADTDRLKFNGWKNEAGESVDFATYTATKTEKFTADLTIYHKVDFVAFGEIVDTQYVKDGEKPSDPSSFGTSPNDGFAYSRSRDCYSLDNVHKCALRSFSIVDDTVIYIIYDKRVTVYFGNVGTCFAYGDNIYDYFINKIEETDYKKFKYFTFEDGSIIPEDYTVNFDIPSFEIFANYANFYDVTYEIDGTIDTSRSQIIEENTFASTSAVASTDRHVFDGWYVDDVKVDISTYVITKTTKFVAKFIDKVQAKFIVDGEQYGDLQYVVVNGKVVKPENPTKQGYTFNGWSIDGSTTVDFENITISTDTVFTALFSEKTDGNNSGNSQEVPGDGSGSGGSQYNGDEG